MLKRWQIVAIGAATVAVVLFSLSFLFSPAYQICTSNNYNQAKECAQHHFGPFILLWIVTNADLHNGLVTAVATALLTIITGGLVILAWQQFILNRDQTRAHVFATNLNWFWYDIGNGKYEWRFNPVWSNTGETHTKEMRLHCRCELRNTVLPTGFNFEYQTAFWGHGLMVAKAANPGGIAPGFGEAAISAQDVADAQAGRKFIYVMGRVIYRDIFPRTPERMACFCWLVTSVGDPFKFVPNDPNNPLTFSWVSHPEGNYVRDL